MLQTGKLFFHEVGPRNGPDSWYNLMILNFNWVVGHRHMVLHMFLHGDMSFQPY